MGDRVDEVGMVHSCEHEPAYRVPQHPGIGGSAPNPYEEAAARQAHNEGYRAGVEAVKKAVLDIDAHATGLAEDEDGFVTGGYLISVGSLHRALGIVGHTAPKCRLCDGTSVGCLRDKIEAETNGALVREILEAMAVEQGVSLESDIEPGQPAPNYKLAIRLGIGQVFGV